MSITLGSQYAWNREGDNVTIITNATASVRNVGMFRAIVLKARSRGSGRSSSSHAPTIEKNIQEGRERRIVLLSHIGHGRVQKEADKNRMDARPDNAAVLTDLEILAASIPAAMAGTPNRTNTWKNSKNGRKTTPENHAVSGNQDVITATTIPENTAVHGRIRMGIVTRFSARVIRIGKASRLNMKSPNRYPSSPSGPTW